MRNVLVIPFMGLLCWASAEQPVRFDNYKLFKVFVDADGHYQSLKNIEKTMSLNFWKPIRSLGDHSDIMVPPGQAAEFEKFLLKTGIGYNVTVDNVQELIDAEKSKTRPAKFGWENYHTLDEINAWVKSTARKFPKQVKLFSIGTSFEGRHIKGMRISYKKHNKAIFVECNIHAIEWITSAVITYIVDQLLTSRDPKVRGIAENLDWYIIPVLNVDGFVYTHEVNRMWRKSRQPHGHPDPFCVGVDMNRNFDFLWNNNYIKMYVALHSYGQLVLSPWGHTEELPKDYGVMMQVANGYVNAVKKRYGTVYTPGSSTNVLYKLSGGSKEWAYGVKGIPLPFTIELRDTGFYGFFLPPEQILPTAEEALDGFVGMIQEARKLKIV